MLDIAKFIAGYIKDHEGGLSMDPADNGNWFDPVSYAANIPQQRNVGKLIGSKFGVTGYALAQYRKVGIVTRADIANLTMDEAVAIGVRLYYKVPGFDKLLVNRVTLSIIDMAWGAGPDRAIRLMQKMIGAAVDGNLGPATARAYATWFNSLGEAKAAQAWADVRNAFYQRIASNEGPNDPDRRFLRGWINRSNSFLPGTSWWSAWA